MTGHTPISSSSSTPATTTTAPPSPRLPPELLLLVKSHIPHSDLRTHVCFHHACRATAAFYGDAAQQAAFWRRACLLAGVGWLRADAAWREVAFETVERDGFCEHPACGGALLDWNAQQVARAMRLYNWDPEDGPLVAFQVDDDMPLAQWVAPPPNADPGLDGDNMETNNGASSIALACSPVFRHVRFGRAPRPAWYAATGDVFLRAELDDADVAAGRFRPLERLVDGAGEHYYVDTGTRDDIFGGGASSLGQDTGERVGRDPKGKQPERTPAPSRIRSYVAELAQHRVACRSFATFPFVTALQLEYSPNGFAAVPENAAGLTVRDVVHTLQEDLDSPMEIDDLLYVLEGSFQCVFEKDRGSRDFMGDLRRYKTLRGLWSATRCEGIYFVRNIPEGPICSLGFSLLPPERDGEKAETEGGTD